MFQKQAARFPCTLEVVVAGAAILIGAVSSRALPYVLLMLLGFWPLRWLAWGRLSVRTPVDLPVAGLVVMASVSLVITALPEKTFPQVLSLLLGMAVFYAIVNWARSMGRFAFLHASLVIFPLLLCVIGIAGVAADSESMTKFPFIPSQVYSYIPHILVDAINPNVLAGNLAFLLPFALSALIFPLVRFSIWIKLIAAGVVVVTAAVGVLTQSRNAIIGLALVFILAFLLRWPKRWYLLLIPPLLAGAAIWYFRDSDQLFFYWLVLRGGALSTLDQRMEIWMRALFMMQDFAFTGIGMGLFPDVSDALYPFSLEPRAMPHAHNLFLQIAVDLGTPGLIAWLAAWLTMLYLAVDLYRKGKGFQGIGAALLISQVVLASVGLLDCVTWGGVKTANLVWVVWGFGVAAWGLANNMETTVKISKAVVPRSDAAL